MVTIDTNPPRPIAKCSGGEKRCVRSPFAEQPRTLTSCSIVSMFASSCLSSSSEHAASSLNASVWSGARPRLVGKPVEYFGSFAWASVWAHGSPTGAHLAADEQKKVAPRYERNG